MAMEQRIKVNGHSFIIKSDQLLDQCQTSLLLKGLQKLPSPIVEQLASRIQIQISGESSYLETTYGKVGGMYNALTDTIRLPLRFSLVDVVHELAHAISDHCGRPDSIPLDPELSYPELYRDLMDRVEHQDVYSKNGQVGEEIFVRIATNLLIYGTAVNPWNEHEDTCDEFGNHVPILQPVIDILAQALSTDSNIPFVRDIENFFRNYPAKAQSDK